MVRYNYKSFFMVCHLGLGPMKAISYYPVLKFFARMTVKIYVKKR